MSRALISPRPLREFTPEDFQEHVRSMYSLRLKPRNSKPPSPAPGISVGWTMSGKLSVRRLSKQRAFDYVTMPEVEKLAAAAKCNQADLWNLLKKKNYIIAKDRLTAERAYAALKGITL